ncbi:MAG TPA: hypothetical protein DCG12_08275 [Planctomycetaceae bacterium]|nr:hypothetical protein [Planctomycetaceae bacterium]
MRALPVLALAFLASPALAQVKAVPPALARLSVDAVAQTPKRIQQLSFTTDSEVVPPPQAGHAFGDEEQQITLETRFLSAPPEVFQKLLKRGSLQVAARSNELSVPDVSDKELAATGGVQLVSAETGTQTHAPVSIQLLEDRNVKALLQAVQGDARSSVLFAPKVTLFNRQTAAIADTRVYPFVVGVVHENGAASPQIQKFEDGTRLAARCRLMKNRGVRLDLHVRMSTMEDVGLLEVQEQGITLQVPTVHTQDIRTSANVPAGRTLVIRGLYRTVEKRVEQPVLKKVPYVSRLFKDTAVGRETEELVLLLTPRIMDIEEELPALLVR